MPNTKTVLAILYPNVNKDMEATMWHRDGFFVIADLVLVGEAGGTLILYITFDLPTLMWIIPVVDALMLIDGPSFSRFPGDMLHN